MTAAEILRFGLACHREDAGWLLYSPIKASARAVALPNDEDEREHGIACSAINDAQERLFGSLQLDQAKRIAIYEAAIADLQTRARTAAPANQLSLNLQPKAKP